MQTESISQALRDKAEEMTQPGYDWEANRQDNSELLRVLARMVEGKTVYKAFGAPGDWGYSNPIGKALALAYKT